jgi:hypothetical protein
VTPTPITQLGDKETDSIAQWAHAAIGGGNSLGKGAEPLLAVGEHRDLTCIAARVAGTG